MRSPALVLVLVLATSSAARADSPIVVRAGLGITRDLDLVTRTGFGSNRIASPTGPGFYLDVGYRFAEHIAAGLHFGITRNSATVWNVDLLGATPMYHEVYTPMQLGISGQWSRGRFWVSPWAGANDGVNVTDHRYFAFGIAAGVDAYVSRCGHRVGGYLDVSDSVKPDDQSDDGHRYVSAGVAYRYW